MKIYLFYFVVLSFSPIIFSNSASAEPSLTISDRIQSHHYLTFVIHATGFMPNTRILAFYYLPDSDKGEGISTFTDSLGNWDRQGGILSSDDIPYGEWKVEAYNVDDDLNRLPNSPYATTEFETPCPFPTTPPDTEIYATVNEKQISSGDSVTSNAINFTYQIRDSFSSFAKFDCKLDEGQYKDCTTIRCEDPNSCGLNPRGTVIDGSSEKNYENLSAGKHVFAVKATDDPDNTDPTPALFRKTILRPIADAGLDQSVKSNDSVQLDGSNSRDVDGSKLNYSWDQIAGPEITLNHANSVDPMFNSPSSTSQINLAFQLIVTNEEGLTSEPDQVIVTVNPISPSPPTEGPQTIKDILPYLVNNLLDTTNSMELLREILHILTDSDRDNDRQYGFSR